MMKNTLLYITFSLIFALPIQAQIDRSKAPEPAPAPEIQIGDYTKFELENGLKVIVVENHKRPTLNVRLTIERDPILEGEHAGFVSMAGELLGTGTTTKTKAEIDEAVDFLGASFSTYSTGMSAYMLTKHTDKMMDIMTDVLYNPSFSEEELNKLKKLTLSGIAAGKEDANAIASNVSQVLNYGKKHPYGEIETEESVESITVDMCKKYYDVYFKPNVSYLVIVGDITVEAAKKMAEQYFADWKKGDVPSRTYQKPTPPNGNHVAFVAKEGAVQSVINITYPINLKPGSSDAIPASVMNSVLGGGVFTGRLMQNLREDKGFTYGARSSISTDKLIGSFQAGASVRNEVTDSSVTEFLYELRRMATEKVDEESLQLVKNSMTGSFARGLESSQTIARFALNIERYNLPQDYYATYLKKLNAVDANEVMAVAKKYIKPDNANIIVVGNTDIADNLAQFDKNGKVNFYDIYGNKTERVNIKPAPEGLTAEKVLNDYILAMTQTSKLKKAEKKLKKVKDITTKSSISVQGLSLEMVSYAKQPNKYAMEVKMGETVIQRQAFDGEKGFMTNMQTGTKDLEGDLLEQMKRQSTMNAELKYDELGYQTKLLGQVTEEGKTYYVIEISDSKGNPSKEFYDAETKLKHKVISQVEDPTAGEKITNKRVFSDYKEVEGILYPHGGSISIGPNMVDFKITQIAVNTKISDNLFEK